MVIRKRTLNYKFNDKHRAYIKRCRECEVNIAEGAVRAGKTVDNVFAFAQELCHFTHLLTCKYAKNIYIS